MFTQYPKPSIQIYHRTYSRQYSVSTLHFTVCILHIIYELVYCTYCRYAWDYLYCTSMHYLFEYINLLRDVRVGERLARQVREHCPLVGERDPLGELREAAVRQLDYPLRLYTRVHIRNQLTFYTRIQPHIKCRHLSQRLWRIELSIASLKTLARPSELVGDKDR